MPARRVLGKESFVEDVQFGKEGSVKDVQFGTIDGSNLYPPASSHYAVVATRVHDLHYGKKGFVFGDVIIGDLLLPVAYREESREQEKEEDSLSTTSTDEESSSEDDEDEHEASEGDILDLVRTTSQTLSEVGMAKSVEENNEGEVGMANSTAIEEKNKGKVGMTVSTPTEENKEDEALNMESRSVSHYVCLNAWRDWLRSDDEWVGKELDRRRRWTWINVYAYFAKEEGYGGYGVILRNAFAKPIVASARFSKYGTSFYYQVFMGIKAGVRLAEKHQCSDFHVECNSDSVPALFRDARRCTSNECRDTCNPYNICKSCEAYFSCYEGCDSLMMPLHLDLRGKKQIVELLNAWGSNAAARYLAKKEQKDKRLEVERKGEKNKRRVVKKKEERIAPDDDGEMEADNFPEELRNIILKDASGMHFRAIGPLVKKDFTM